MQEKYKPYTYHIDEDGTVTESSTSAIPGFKETTNFKPRYSNKPKQKRSISKFFSDLSRLGMDYEGDVIKNMRAIPADKNLIPAEQKWVAADIFASNNWKVKSNADKDFYEKDLSTKREALRNLAVQPELEDILTVMTNEAVVYDSELTYFLEPFIEAQELDIIKKEVRDNIIESMNTHFRRFYKMLNWKTGAWNDFYKWLIEGVLAWEIVWDSLEKPKRIIGIIAIDPATLTRKFDNGKWYWIQFKGIQGRERKLLDAQIIYLAYNETNSVGRTSYLERLVRPFNIYRIIEQAQVIWTITNSSMKMKFTIPTKGMTRAMGTQTVASAMNRYKEDIKFNADSGELTINGSANLPFSKEYWFADSDSGTPDIETIGGDGPDLSNNDQLEYFRKQLYRVSKIPFSRFDQDSGETWFGSDPTSAYRCEIDFSRFVGRLRNQFAQVMIKPLQLQLAKDYPELLDNRDVLEAVSLQWNGYNLFEENMERELMAQRVEFVQNTKDSLSDFDSQGNEIKYFSSKFLVTKYLKLSPQDIALNAKMKKEEAEENKLAGSDAAAEADDETDSGGGGW